MDQCGCGEGFAAIFDERLADQDRDRYRRQGPARTTRLLLDLVAPGGAAGQTLLDIGGGIGAIGLELLRSGAGHAVLVEGSTAFLAVARQEARRANVLDRMEFVEGDFVRRADGLDAADIVTLDRVICCYPDVDRLVSAAAGRTRRRLGIVVPRDRRLTRLGLALQNAWMRLRRNPYRGFAHPNARIDDLARAQGLVPVGERRTWWWRVAVYQRQDGTALT
jgi:magnesium-protoporphyrin O-methyltransferase